MKTQALAAEKCIFIALVHDTKRDHALRCQVGIYIKDKEALPALLRVWGLGRLKHILALTMKNNKSMFVCAHVGVRGCLSTTACPCPWPALYPNPQIRPYTATHCIYTLVVIWGRSRYRAGFVGGYRAALNRDHHPTLSPFEVKLTRFHSPYDGCDRWLGHQMR